MLRIVEVGPRDGLQNEPQSVPTQVKAEFVSALVKAGLREIEVTSFVSPKRVPQLGDAAELWPLLENGPLYSALVPNSKGLERAMEVGVTRIAVFTAVSETFVQKNIGMTVEESIKVFESMIKDFRSKLPGGWVRGYLSTAFECPYEGRIDLHRTNEMIDRLAALGVDEVSIGDTIGVAGPSEVKRLAQLITVPKERIAWHFHDTRGTGIANVAAALEEGFTAYDASAAGLGGCNFAPGAGGNLSTEDLVYFLEREGIATGIDLRLLAEASLPVLQAIGRHPMSKSQSAQLAACK